ncbi:MAG: YraN family protein [Planctomycetaceae bacterium]|nr:MAG: YraN family protein [Planctomycetaceae bacterium]
MADSSACAGESASIFKKSKKSKHAGDGGLGPVGEKLACKFLRKAGMKILATNYRCPSGEIDIIALDKSTRKAGGCETIVFVEVKTRNNDAYTDPQSAVDSDKRRRIRKAATYYLSTRDTSGFAVRYDIIAIVAKPGQEPKITHIPAAFE